MNTVQRICVNDREKRVERVLDESRGMDRGHG